MGNSSAPKSMMGFFLDLPKTSLSAEKLLQDSQGHHEKWLGSLGILGQMWCFQ